MFCSKCGKELKEGAKFCTSCGQPIQSKTSSNVSETPVKIQVHQAASQDEKQTQNSVEEHKEGLAEQKIPVEPAQSVKVMPNGEKGSSAHDAQIRKGIWGLVVLLVVLVFVALGCLLYIISLQKSDNNSINADEENTVQAEDDEKDAGNAIDEYFSAGEGESAEETIEIEADYLKKAREAYMNNDYVIALQYCDMALQADNLNEEAYSLEADIYLEQQEIEQAANILNEGIAATDSSNLKYCKEQLVTDVNTTACSQYNSLGTLICEVEYDASGNAVRYISYSDGKNISSIEECGYDSWGRMVSKSHYNGSMMFEWQEVYDYNSAGYVSGCTYYNAKNKKEWFDEYTYDVNGRQIQTTRYNADGTLSWWDEYTYISDENVIKTAHPSTGETVVIQITCVFDQMGNQTEYAEYDASGVCTYGWQKEYNGLGHVTKYIYGDSEINYIYDYVYK